MNSKWRPTKSKDHERLNAGALPARAKRAYPEDRYNTMLNQDAHRRRLPFRVASAVK